ncbi:MAG: hypothetical protein AAFQ67_01830, partial [Pseudomonadota bacterium]
MHFGHSVLIDVIAERPRLDMILARLRAAGLEPSRYRSRDADNNRPLLIDLSSAGHTAIFDAIAVLSSGASAVFVLGDRLPDGLDQAIHIERDADLMDVYDKVRAHSRASIEAHESSLFLETLAEFGVTPPDINERPRILLVGKYSPKFLGLQTAL